MAAFFSVLLGLVGLSAKALLEKGRNCVDMLTGNASFTLPAGFLASITTACNTLEQANEEVLFYSGKVNYDAKRKAERVLADLIRELAGYVQAQSVGDSSKILSAGFDYRKKGQPVEKLDTPGNFRGLLTTFIGTVDLRWNQVADATNNQLFICSTDPDKEENWELVGFTSKGRYTVEGLESGKFYWFRVQAMGRKGLLSPMSGTLKMRAA